MADTVTTLRPNGTASAGPWTASATTLHGDTSDNSDATYINLSPPGSCVLDLSTFTVPAGAIIRSVTVRVRADTVFSFVSADLILGGSAAPMGSASTSGSFVTYTLGTSTVAPDGHAWTQSNISALQIRLNCTSGLGVNVREVYVDVAYNQAPTATVTAPTGTSTTNSRPPVAWTYSDPEGDHQERYWVKVFSAAQYGAGGFNPETSTATWGSGQVLSSATSATPAKLANGTYRAYVKVADVGSGGRWGPWAFSGFVVNVASPPAAPTLTATADTAHGRVTLDLTDGNGSLAGGLTYTATVERSADGGDTWQQVRVAIGSSPPSYDPIPITSAGRHYTNLYDYEAPYGALLYRAIEAADDGAGGELVGTYSSSAAVTFAPIDTWLLDPLDPSTRVILDPQLPFKYSRRIRASAVDVLGGPLPVARSDGSKGEMGELSVDTVGQDEHDALDLIVGSGQTLLLRIPGGERGRYLFVTSNIDTVVVALVDSASGFRTSTFQWVEVAAP